MFNQEMYVPEDIDDIEIDQFISLEVYSDYYDIDDDMI